MSSILDTSGYISRLAAEPLGTLVGWAYLSMHIRLLFKFVLLLIMYLSTCYLKT